MKDIEIKILEENGWCVECKSPLEIRYEDGSFATGVAALLIIDLLCKEETEYE